MSPNLALDPLTSRDTFELPGGAGSKGPGVLFLHGFMGDPREVRPLAEWIQRRCHLYCYGVLLPSHGGMPHLLSDLSYSALLAAAQAAYDHVAARCASVIVCGYSMGAALAALLLETRPAAAYIGIAPMISIRGLVAARLISLVMPEFYFLEHFTVDDLQLLNALIAFDPDLKLDDPIVVARLRQELRFPLGVFEELKQIATLARQTAPHMTVPTLILQGDIDPILNPAGARQFYESIGAKDKRLIVYRRAGHRLVVRGATPAFPYVLADVSAWIEAHFPVDQAAP